MQKLLAQSLQIIDDTSTYTISGPAGFQFETGGVAKVISDAIAIVFAIAGVGLLLMIITAGYTLMTSAGDAKKTEAGKNRLTYAIVGFIIIFVAYWIVQLFGIMFGLPSITETFTFL